jgi:hypothetical protein
MCGASSMGQMRRRRPQDQMEGPVTGRITIDPQCG